MALADTGNAIGAVSELLQHRLLSGSGIVLSDVTVGATATPAHVNNPRLNLFLYEVSFDGPLQNVPLDDGQPAPQWLVLHYFLTAFDVDGNGDSIEAHKLLGQGVRALQNLNFFSLKDLPPDTTAALSDNPELLKLKFVEASSELITRLMQGVNEQYRCGVSFEVRPVMLAPAQPPDYSLLVGVNYATGAIVGDAGVARMITPSLGPELEGLSPLRFELGASLTLTGNDLNLPGLSVMLGAAELPVTMQQPNRLSALVPASLGDGATISAGSLTVSVLQTLPSGRRRGSNLLVGGLAPQLTTVAASGLTKVHPADPTSPVRGTLDLTGILMGTAADNVIVAFYRDGQVTRAFDSFTRPAGPPFQRQMTLVVDDQGAVPPGIYRVLLRVNGQQAANSPMVNWVA